MDEIKAKQQVVEKIKEASKILVTVSDSPSVDALSAALGLTMILDKQEKYATSIFSGETPPAIAFLEPEKTFDDTTDSLRDFIIALNKEKADHLRYKVEGDSVKIFITPYKTTIDQSDLEFSQGDYNVELVIALGVDSQEHFDKALEGHGQILHDAAIITITAGDQSSDLGGIDWHDANASSLSEMISGLAEALKEDKKKSLLDQSIATALLTGIVAETDRFSNEHTTSRAMTVSATLMAAGADQQLIANELQASQDTPVKENDSEPFSSEPEAPTDDAPSEQDEAESVPIDPSTLAISHEDESLAELDRRVLGEEKAKEKVTDEVEAIQEDAALREQKEAELEAQEEPKPAQQPLADTEVSDEPIVATAPSDEDEPTLGGTLNATAEQAADDARREEERSRNHTILSHANIGEDEQSTTAPEPSFTDSSQSTLLQDDATGFPGTPPVAPGSLGVNDFSSSVAETVHSAYAAGDATDYEPTASHAGTSEERIIQPLEPSFDTTNAVPAANTAYAPESTATPADLGLPLPPPIPDFSQVNGAVPAMPMAQPGIPIPQSPQQPAILGDIFAPEPAPAYLGDTTNAVPAVNTAYAPESLPPIATQPVEQAQPQPASNDPGQFQIPTQQ